MTTKQIVRESKAVRRLAANEIIEAFGEPVKDEASGVERFKAKADKDGKEGYVSLAGNQGSVYLEAYDMNTAGRKRAEQALQDLNDEASRVHRVLESKTSDLRSV